MELKKSDTNFGMAFISPNAKDMLNFKKYLAKAAQSGKIDTMALGDFVTKQANNKKVNMQYRCTANGDVFEVMAPGKVVTVPIPGSEPVLPENRNIFSKLKDWCNNKIEKIEYDPVGSWDNLPSEMKKAGEIADKLEKELA